MTAGRVRGGVEVTGVAQRDAWRRRVLPPAEQVRPGLWSVPVPIPDNPLRYTLCYAFADGGTVVLVDPGWDSPAGRQAVEAGLAAAGAAPRDVAGVVVTHIHPDHHGLSRWIRECSGAWIAMHPAEAHTLPGRLRRDRDAADDRRWLLGHGVPEEDLATLILDPGQMDDVLRMAEPDRLINDGDPVPVPGRDVRAVWTPGHTPGHLCLHDAAAGVLLTGDHLLPRISPNIGVLGGIGPGGPPGAASDPLSAYLRSLGQTARFHADEALPAHEYRFRGIGGRAAALAAHHDARGAELLTVIDRLGRPTAWALAAQLTWSRGWAALHGMMRRMALAETVAHLHHLTVTSAVHPAGGTPLRWSRAETLTLPAPPPG